MVEFTSALATTLIGMMGVVVGAAISNYVNQMIAAKSARRDLLFKKKVEYFDRVVNVIEQNIKLYRTWQRKLETRASKALIENTIKTFKKKRAHFDIKTSALYVNVDAFSRDIKQFVAYEKHVFALVERLKQEEYESTMDTLRQVLHSLEQAGTQIISKMHRSLMRD